MFSRRVLCYSSIVSAALLTNFSPASFAQTAQQSAIQNLVINELDADTPSTDTAEFIEIFDGGAGNTALDGTVLVLFNGNGDNSYQAIDLDGYSTNENGYFVLGNSSVANTDLIFNNGSLQNGADAAVLYNADAADFPNASALTTNNIIDAIVYDTNDSDDAGLLALLNDGQAQINEGANGNKNNDSLQRCANGSGGQRNSDSFIANTPTPGADNQCPSEASLRLIHDIQGETGDSPLQGELVIVEAIVVGDFQRADQLNGFFLQEADSHHDAKPTTSEGIFVFAPNSADVEVGDVVRVTGRVSEYNGLTEISNITELNVIDQSQDVTATEVALPVTSASELERLEGMLVTFTQPVYVTETYNLGRYGELVVSGDQRLPNPTNITQPGASALTQAQTNSLNRLVIDDASSIENPTTIPYPAPELSAFNSVRGGDSVVGLGGILSYGLNQYRLQPTVTPIIVADNARTAAPTLLDQGSLTVSSFNVLNFFNGDGSPQAPDAGFPTSRGADSLNELNRQRDKIIAAIIAIDADILGLIEIENDGFGEHSAITDLVSHLNDASPHHYDFVKPTTDTIGRDAITVGFIYNTQSVELDGDAKILDSNNSAIDSETGEPLFLDSKNRPVLAQTFRELSSAARVTLALNHLKSKGSSCNDLNDPDLGDGQGNCNLTRTNAAIAQVNWLANQPTGTTDPDVLIMGDLNAYAKEDPISAIKFAGFHDLLEQHIPLETRYSYVFNGEWGYLDHALASDTLLPQIAGATVWHINADEPRALDYNLEFKTDEQQTALYNADPYRSSDHDPVIVSLQLDSSFEDITDYVNTLAADGRLVGTGSKADKNLQHFLTFFNRTKNHHTTQAYKHRPYDKKDSLKHTAQIMQCISMLRAKVRSDAKPRPHDWVSGDSLNQLQSAISYYLDKHCRR